MVFQVVLYLLLAFMPSGCAREMKSLPPPAASETCAHTDTEFRCVKYVGNYDGDTIRFDIPGAPPVIGKNISVRVFGVDTAEIKTADACEKRMGRITQKMVESLLRKARRVDLVNVQRDKYFRLLADVYVDGRSLRDLLIKNQLAYEYFGETKQRGGWCEREKNLLKNRSLAGFE